MLEQLCDVFHEAVQKYVVELERQALSGEFYFIPKREPFNRSASKNDPLQLYVSIQGILKMSWNKIKTKMTTNEMFQWVLNFHG